jgi:two-component system, NtrC family, sensor kinase
MQEFNIQAHNCQAYGQAELEPFTQEARFRQLADSIPGMIYQFQMAADGSFCFTFVSSGCRELFELTPETIEQDASRLIEMIHPDDRPGFDQSVARSAATLEPWHWEGRFILPSGRIRWVQGASRPVCQPNRAILWSGQLMDVSQRKQMEVVLKYLNDELEERVEERTKELLESEAKFRELFERSTDAILLFDGEVFIDCNKAAIKMLRCRSKEQVLQLHPSVLSPEIQPDGQPSFEKANAMIDIAFRQGNHRFEWMHRRADGEDFWVEVVLTVIELEGRPTLYTVWREIEARKAAETALAASEARFRTIAAQNQIKARELEDTLQELRRTQTQMIQSEKMSSLGQLVAGVAHEINNPVNFIYGNLNHANSYIQDLLTLLDLYQQYHPTPHPEIQATADAIDLEFLQQDLPKLLQSMKVGADRIQQIVTSLRTFSRMDEAEMKAVNIHEGIDSTLLILQSRLKGKPSHPEVQIIKEYDHLPLVECYAGQLNQVFMNILTNAIDALEEALIPTPQIYIRTELINSERVRISIQDNGLGISEAVHQRIFDPFFTTKPIGKGTGMGMSISYQIITERHGGRLTCRSLPNKGAEFLIEIPINQNV